MRRERAVREGGGADCHPRLHLLRADEPREVRERVGDRAALAAISIEARLGRLTRRPQPRGSREQLVRLEGAVAILVDRVEEPPESRQDGVAHGAIEAAVEPVGGRGDVRQSADEEIASRPEEREVLVEDRERAAHELIVLHGRRPSELNTV